MRDSFHELRRISENIIMDSRKKLARENSTEFWRWNNFANDFRRVISTLKNVGGEQRPRWTYLCTYTHTRMRAHTHTHTHNAHVLCSQYRYACICKRTYIEARVHHTSARVSKWNEISLLFIARVSEYQCTSAATCRLCRAALSRLTAVSKELLCDERAGSTWKRDGLTS